MLRATSSSGGGNDANFSTLTVTGQSLFADGSAAAPSIAFISQPNTGLYWRNSSVIGFAAGGSSAFEVRPSVLSIASTIPLGWSSSVASGISDTTLSRDAAGLIGISSSFSARGGAGFGMRAISGSYSVQTADYTICCSTASGGLTVQLPLAPAMNQYLNIKKVSADANRLTIDGNGNLIDALSTQSTIATTRPSFALQFGSTVASPTGSAWQLL